MREVGVPVDQLKSVKWSIIIPVLNEEKNISDTLHSIIKVLSNLTEDLNHDTRKLVFGGSDQVRYKPTCTVTKIARSLKFILE